MFLLKIYAAGQIRFWESGISGPPPPLVHMYVMLINMSNIFVVMATFSSACYPGLSLSVLVIKKTSQGLDGSASWQEPVLCVECKAQCTILFTQYCFQQVLQYSHHIFLRMPAVICF